MKWVSISVKSARELGRNRVALFFSLLFPVIFVLIFGAAFGQFSGGKTTYRIAVINLDEGIEINGSMVNHGENITTVLELLQYQDENGQNTSHVFDVRTDLNPEQAQSMVEDRNLDGYIIIPPEFSEGVTAEAMEYVYSALMVGAREEVLGGDNGEDGEDDGGNGGPDGGGGSYGGGVNLSNPDEYEPLVEKWLNRTMANRTRVEAIVPQYRQNVSAVVSVQGDPSRTSYFVVSGILEELLELYIDGVGLLTLDAMEPYLPFVVDPEDHQEHVVFENRGIDVRRYSAFDYQVPGIIIFGLLIGSLTVAIFMAREESEGTLERLKLTRMSSFDLLFGTTVPFTFLLLAQVLILIGVALLMGYNYNAGANLALALFVALWGCLATVALGLMIAALAKDEDQAGTLGPAVVVPLSFVTSAFFPLPTVVLLNDFLGTGRPFEVYDWLPWTQCSKALAKILTFGAGPEDIVLELGLMMVSTTMLFALSVWLYHTRRLKSQ